MNERFCWWECSMLYNSEYSCSKEHSSSRCNVVEDWFNSVVQKAYLSFIVYFEFKKTYHNIDNNTDFDIEIKIITKIEILVEAVVEIKIVYCVIWNGREWCIALHHLLSLSYMLWYITLHYITLHYITLHYNTLHNTT